MTWRWIGLSVLLMVSVGGYCRADIIHLKDGSTVRGDMKRGGGGYLVTQADGSVRALTMDQVKSIEVASASTAPAPDQAMRNLQSLERSLVNVDDPKKAIEKYNRFIESASGTSAELQARKDLAIWQERADKGLVKVANQWVTPSERAQMHEQAIEQASVARRLLRQGKIPEAGKMIDLALTNDPQSAAALYLRGLYQYSTGKVAPARATFEQVNHIVPNNAAVLNNLAVIAARQNQPSVALGYYDQAMNASPENRDVLDNVAEALYTLPDSARGSAIAQRVASKFARQDAKLASAMESKGLHRWGATWVSTDQLNQLSIAEKQTNQKLDQMSADFDKLQVRLNNIDRDIQENDRAMSTLGQGIGYARDLYGNLYPTDNTATRSQLDQDNQRLMSEREDTLAQLNRLAERARSAQGALPVPKYTGIQRLMDESHAPVLPVEPPAPATQPSKSAGEAPVITTQPT
jgi:tetratricopeptide (TPR) repeat protein